MSRRLALLAFAVLVAGCGSTPPGPPAGTPTGSPPPAAAGRPVSFPAADGAPLSGRLYGTGAVGVVLSAMGDNDPGAWDRFAPTLAGQGYRVLTYAYRYPARPTTFTPEMARGAVDDLRGAAAYLRAQGAMRLVLVGASLGGMATAKAAGEIGAAGVVVISAPAAEPGIGLTVEAAELAAMTGPKLFIASEADPVVPMAETRRLYDMAAEPREWRAFPGAAHGTQLFDSEHGDALAAALVAFVSSTA
jgi:uncharacterized protein